MTFRAGRNNQGFSLIELILVLMLLGLSSLIVVPTVGRSLRDREVQQTALGLAAVARDLRSRAVHDGTPQQLVLNLTQNSYVVAREREIQLPSEVNFAGVKGGETSEDGLRKFLFFANGSNLGGEIGFAGTHRSARYSVRMEPLTGRIEVTREKES